MHKIILCLTTVVLLAALPATRSSAQEAPKKSRPVLAIVEIRGLNAVEKAINSIRTKLMLPIPPNSLDTALGALASIGVDTSIIDIDRDATTRLFVFIPQDTPGITPQPSIVMATGLTDDPDAVFQSLAAAMKQTDLGSGMFKFSTYPEESEVGATRDMFVKSHGKTMIIGLQQADVANIAARFESGKLKANSRLPVKGVVALRLNVSELASLVKKGLDQTAAVMGAMGDPTGQGMDPGAILNAQGEVVDAFLGQLAILDVSIDVEDDGIALQTRSVAKADTAIARMFEQAKPPRDAMWSLLPNDVIFAQVGHLASFDEFIALYTDSVKKLYAVMGDVGESLSEVIPEMMESSRGIFAGDYAAALLTGTQESPFRAIYYFQVTDTAGARKKIDEMIKKSSAAMTEAYASMGMGAETFRLGSVSARKHDGHQIDRYASKFDFAALAPEAANMGMLDAFSEFNYEIAYVDDLAVMTMGDANVMNQALAALKKPGDSILSSGMFATLFPKPDQKPARITNVSLVNYVKMILSFMPFGNEQMLQMIQPSNSGLSGYAYTKGRIHHGAWKIGFSELQTLKGVIPMLMMGAMQQQGGAPLP